MTVTTKDVLRELQSLGTAQNRKVYARHGVKGPCFGVSYAHLEQLRKRIRTDHDLALALWECGNHDARILATQVADPSRTTASILKAWARDLDNYVLTDALAKLAARSPAAPVCMKAWLGSKGEWAGAAGWTILAIRAMEDPSIGDRELAGYLERIESGIAGAGNRVRYAMNNALIAIGGTRAPLRESALALARRIGPVEVDHGETGCKTPDAAVTIAKMAARAKKRAP